MFCLGLIVLVTAARWRRVQPERLRGGEEDDMEHMVEDEQANNINN